MNPIEEAAGKALMAPAERASEAARAYGYGCGYSELHLWDTAATELARVPADAPDDLFALARCELVFVELRLGTYRQAAMHGLAQIEGGAATRRLLAHTALALHYDNRTREARDLYLRYPAYLNGPDNQYGRACYESALEDFDAALECLERAFAGSDEYWLKAMVDSDLAPLWGAWDAGPPSLAQAHRLVMPEFGALLERAAAFQGEFEMDDEDRKRLPARFRPLLDFPPGGELLKLNPRRAAEQPTMTRDYFAWQRERADANVRRLRAAREAAREMVLAAQVGYAGEKAAAGNFLGARWHLIWALSERPAMLPEFQREPRLQRWAAELLAPAAAAQALDPDVFPRLARTDDGLGGEPINDFLEGFPEAVRTNPFYAVRLAAHLKERGEHERAVPMFLELCQAWRQDAAAFSNGALSLARLDRWEEAQALLDLAPPCARALPRFVAQCEAMAARTDRFDAPRLRPFCGQPDLGGLLPARLIQAELFAVTPR